MLQDGIPGHPVVFVVRRARCLSRNGAGFSRTPQRSRDAGKSWSCSKLVKSDSHRIAEPVQMVTLGAILRKHLCPQQDGGADRKIPRCFECMCSSLYCRSWQQRSQSCCVASRPNGANLIFWWRSVHQTLRGCFYRGRPPLCRGPQSKGVATAEVP